MDHINDFLSKILQMDVIKIRWDDVGDFSIIGENNKSNTWSMRSINLENYVKTYRFWTLFSGTSHEQMTSGDISIEDGNKLIRKIRKEVKKLK